MTKVIGGVVIDERCSMYTPTWEDIHGYTWIPLLRALLPTKQASMIPQRTPVLFLARCVFQTAGKTLSMEIYESYLLILQVGKLVSRDRKEIYNLNQRLEQVTGTKVWIHRDVRAPGCCPILYPTRVYFNRTLMGMPPYFITGKMKSEKQQGPGSPTMTQRRAKLNSSSAPEGRSFWHFQALSCPPSCYSGGSPSPWDGRLVTLWPQRSGNTAGWYGAADLTLGTTTKLL